MTDAPRAQSVLPDSIAGALDEYGYAACSGAADTASKRVALTRAIADALEAKDEAFLKLAGENKNRRHANEKLEQELAASRAENAALAKLADELSVDHRDDDTFDAGVRYALFILGFEKEAVEANDASKALRAGQQKG